MRMLLQALTAGVLLGIVFTLSPLLVIALVGFALLLRWVRNTPDPSERRWLVALLVAAVAARFAVIAALFLSTNHETTPFGRLFGDEEYFIRRGIWLSNVALGIPISIADVRYAFDELIHTSFVWMLASLNVLFGPAPYGVRFVSAVLYLAAAVALHRIVRPSFGKAASLAGLALLLFLPSLFIWSISVLKEPVFFAAMVVVVAVTVTAGRSGSWPLRFAAVFVVAAAALVAETIRDGGLVVAAAGTAAGIIGAVCLARPRILAAAAVVAIAAAPVLLSNGRVQDQATAVAAAAARRHWDHVNAPGHSYLLFAPAFYREEPVPGGMTRADEVRLAAGGLAAYVLVPLPWQMQSRAELAYLPEQIVWYGLVMLLPIGVAAGMRRDLFLTSILLGHLVVSVVLVAWTSGNIGTLVRHRALAMPYVVWFGGLGFSVALAWFMKRREARA
jgi:hypothetical protein